MTKKKDKRAYVELVVQLFGATETPLAVRDRIRHHLLHELMPEFDHDLEVEITMHSGLCKREECGNDDAHLSHEEDPLAAKP